MSDVIIRVIPSEDITIWFYSADIVNTKCRDFGVYIKKKNLLSILKEGESGYSLNLDILLPILSS